MDEYMAIIKLFAGSFAPRTFAYCNGAIISIAQNSALFALIGTTFGGDGRTTFALPNLNGRVAVGTGNSQMGSSYVLGQVAGTESVIVTQNQMPQHLHNISGLNSTSASAQVGSAIAAAGDATTPVNNYLALSPKIGSGPNATQLKTYATAAAGTPAALGGSGITTTTTTTGTTAIAGGSQPIPIMQPYLAMTYLIVTQGIFPSRN